MRFLRVFAFVCFFSALAASMAFALYDKEKGESYAVPTFRDMVQTVVMMGGLDINDPKVADEYAKLFYCAMYAEKFKDDFEWNKIRQKMISKVSSKTDYYRVLYEIPSAVYLGRYEFESQSFPFVKDTGLLNVGAMALLDLPYQEIKPICLDRGKSEIFSYSYFLELAQPLTFDRLKIPPDGAQKLLDKIQQIVPSKSPDRRLYVRFRVRVISAGDIDVKKGLNVRSNLRGEVTAIDIFYDKDMTKQFASIEVK